MKKFIAIAGTALLLAACTPKAPATTETDIMEPVATPVVTARPTGTPIAMMNEGSSSAKPSFKLTAQNNSKQDGTVMFEEVAGKVKVTVQVANATAAAEPAHIHAGVCPKPGDVKYPLTDVVNGKSETTLPAGVTLASLADLGKLSVNVHKSKAEIATYLSCGNLDFSASMTKASPSGSAMTSSKASASPKASAM